MKSRLICRNKIITINPWAVSLMRYGEGTVKWTKRELNEIDRKTRKVMTLNKELHPRSMYLGWKRKKIALGSMSDITLNL